MKLTSLTLATLALALATDVEAIPAVKTYRGVSRYVSQYEAPPDTNPALRNPRGIPGVRTMRLGSNTLVQESFKDEVHYVSRQDKSTVFWNSVRDRMDTAINKMDQIAALFGINSAASMPLRTASRLVQGAAEGLGLSFKLNRNQGSLYSEVDIHYNVTDKLVWGEEAHLSQAIGMDDLPHLPQDSGFDYINQKVRGVNLGNWLLFEGWMDSRLMSDLNSHAVNAPYPNAIIDEWTAGQYGDPGWTSYILQRHFDEWMTEDDWRAIRDAGLNHVRIPVPYFMFAEAKGPNAPYLTLNRFAKLKEGVLTAKRYGLKVWIDLHSVPGSQNGFDNSGRAGPIHWANNREYYTQTQYAFNRLVTEFTQNDYLGTVTAIQAVNEPQGRNQDILNLVQEYYVWARNKVAMPDGWDHYSTTLLAVHDAFLGLQYWQDFWTGQARHRVLLDTHPYFVYTDEQKRTSDSGRLKMVCDLSNSFVQSQAYYPSIAGEFGINGPNGDRDSDRDLPNGPVDFPDGPDYPYSKRYMAFMARNFRTQQEVYEKGSGWIMWSWRNDGYLDWSYQAGLRYGWIPRDLNAKPYGDNMCSQWPYLQKQVEQGLADKEWEEYENRPLVFQNQAYDSY